jgi:hypothetical protein
MKFELQWSDIGRAEEPGAYPYRGGVILITTKHLTAWERDPDGVWEIASVIGPRGVLRYMFRNFRPSRTDELGPDRDAGQDVE